jgi:hypothetical protein
VFGFRDVDGFGLSACVGLDVDVGIDGNRGAQAEEAIEPVGKAGGEDGGPTVAGVVLGAGAEGDIQTPGEWNDAAGACVICGGGGCSAARRIIA